MRRFGVRPDRDLGQNFLIDSNILGVIDRAAALGAEDVVLEIGGGLGVLSEYLAERVAHVHVLEIDERLRDALHDATDPHANVTVHWADAMSFDLATLDPAPEKVVANLPYGIAAGMLLRSIEELPGVRSWVVMAQREVGERLAAGPGSGAYGVPSVLAQLSCEVEVLRTIPRTVFVPVPNVDSVLVGLRRRPGASGALPPLRARARGRRLRPPAQDTGGLARSLRRGPGSLAGAGAGGPRRSAAAGGRAGRAPLAGGVPFARGPAREMSVHRALAPAKINLGLFLGPHPPRRRASRARHGDAVDLARRRAHAGARRSAERSPTSWCAPEVPGPPEDNLAGRALGAFRAATGWDGPPLRLSVRKRIPLAAGLAGGSADAAAVLRLASRASGLGDERLLRRLGAELGADVSAQIAPGRWLASGAGERLEELAPAEEPFGVLVLPAPGGLATAAVYARGGPARPGSPRARPRAAPGRAALGV